jgi:hypothetical protein
MSTRIPAVLLAVGCLSAAPAARAADLTGSSITLEAFGGYQHLQGSPGAAVAGAVTGEGTAIIGGDILWKASLFGLGLSLDKTVSGNFNPWAGSVMLGLVFDLLPSLRLEALGEIGRVGADFGDMFGSAGSTFVGLRPGLSFRLLPTPLRIGVGGLVRWPTSGGDIGSPTYGLVAKVGVEFP